MVAWEFMFDVSRSGSVCETIHENQQRFGYLSSFGCNSSCWVCLCNHSTTDPYSKCGLCAVGGCGGMGIHVLMFQGLVQSAKPYIYTHENQQRVGYLSSFGCNSSLATLSPMFEPSSSEGDHGIDCCVWVCEGEGLRSVYHLHSNPIHVFSGPCRQARGEEGAGEQLVP